MNGGLRGADGSSMPRRPTRHLVQPRQKLEIGGQWRQRARVRVRSDGLEVVGGEAGSDGEAEELRDRVGDR